ncbi:flagellar basal body rod protein FlgB [Microvirga massiliensis]|uniref:flagellar basal body rod protein FlgB n=1 Tax=Microvirga massiliensis TaxID=1033741 RepID=UPI00062BE530|nr:flagellar basal body rod protein FlgB [Microvirga massiliensis]
MTVSNLPLIAMLKTRMHWHQARQKVLAENVSNSDTPGFAPRDLAELRFTARGQPSGGNLPIVRTASAHLAGEASRPGESEIPAGRFETRPSGNAVSLEEEMLKASQNQADFQLATSLYQKSLQMLRIAAGRGR